MYLIPTDIPFTAVRFWCKNSVFAHQNFYFGVTSSMLYVHVHEEFVSDGLPHFSSLTRSKTTKRTDLLTLLYKIKHTYVFNGTREYWVST